MWTLKKVMITSFLVRTVLSTSASFLSLKQNEVHFALAHAMMITP